MTRIGKKPISIPYGIKVAPDGTPWAVLLGTNKLASADPETLEITEYTMPEKNARPKRLEITDDGTDIMFKISLTGDPVATDWGKYLVAIDSVPGGDSAGNGCAAFAFCWSRLWPTPCAGLRPSPWRPKRGPFRRRARGRCR